MHGLSCSRMRNCVHNGLRLHGTAEKQAACGSERPEEFQKPGRGMVNCHIGIIPVQCEECMLVRQQDAQVLLIRKNPGAELIR